MYSLKRAVEEQASRGYVERVEKVLNPELEPTKYMKKADRAGSTVVFRVSSSEIECVSGVVNTRRKLYELLKAGSDEEAYTKLSSSLDRKSANSRELKFTEQFEVFSNSLTSLPAIKFYSIDGGRYITSSIVIARTPDLDSFNASVHRLMVLDDRSMAIRLVPRHLYRIYELNKKAGRDTEVAIVIGAHPLVELASSMSPPYGVFELEMVEHLGGEPLEIVYTPMYGIPVPAYASIVIEGRITRSLAREGPFVDIFVLPDRVREQPVVVVDRMYVSRNREYFHVILPGGGDHLILMGFPREAAIWESVRRVVPRVRKVRLTRGGGMWLHAVISISKEVEGEGKTAIMAAFAAHPSLKHVVVVDEDIDPDDLEEVEWAIATRLQASRGLVVIRNARGSTLDPSSDDGLTDKVGIDATAPLARRDMFRRPEE
ncbi:MAG: UbiD family decarboxylase [Sulfolobales archaeon]|nr:UbiD family decarboxylase [Sulfolobales archaeon]MCX8208810.1 UbiD family decarboxylase [Sulfolobales archaeon]MDW8010740.1 UbiD family decarboxylase [Sulfolobales archaeon]